MPTPVTGPTTTGSLSDSLPSIIAGARIVREYDGVFQRTADWTNLKEGTGLDWNEIALAQLSAQTITESTILDNPQQIQDSLFQIEPLMTGIMLRITDRTYRRIANVVEAKCGQLAGNAMVRRKDQDYLAMFSTFGTGASPGTGNPLTFGNVSAAVNRIESNVTEPGMSPINTILHGFQVYDLQNEIVTGIGTYTIPEGMTEEVYRQGWKGTVAGSQVFTDGNITVDSTPDANGATHARDAVVGVQGASPRRETRRRPDYGGGADEIFMYDEYALGERSSGNWAYLLKSDATAPTS